jgi:hypothetical protein
MRNGIWAAEQPELHLLAFAVDYIRKVYNIVHGSRTNNQYPRDHQIQLAFEASYLAAHAPSREEDHEMPSR